MDTSYQTSSPFLKRQSEHNDAELAQRSIPDEGAPTPVSQEGKRHLNIKFLRNLSKKPICSCIEFPEDSEQDVEAQLSSHWFRFSITSGDRIPPTDVEDVLYRL